MSVIRRDPDRLYNLLPALHRTADSDRGEPLRALLGAIGAQADALLANTRQLWDDYFIETCQRWVIPYIGALVGNVPLHDLDPASAAHTARTLFEHVLAGPNFTAPGAIRLRADVAKTIAYRRRKGTPSMLEELARDVTGWDVHVVEFFAQLDWTHHLEHLRPHAHECMDLRRVDACQRLGGAWDTSMRTVDVRPISGWDGWYNISNIGFFIWRLRAWPLDRTTPRAIGGTSWRCTFSPLGQDTPLYASGQVGRGDSDLVAEPCMQAPIRSGAFFVEPLAANAPIPPPNTTYYGEGPAASLVVRVSGTPVPAANVRCSNLESWGPPFTRPTGDTLLIDVVRGRLIVPDGYDPALITVDYHYGFAAALGGGTYDRRKWVVDRPTTNVAGGGPTLDDLVAARAPAVESVFTITDNATYDLSTTIELQPDEHLILQAASGQRPHLLIAGGELRVTAVGGGAQLTLSGLTVEGSVRVVGDLAAVRIVHCTLVPDRSACQEDANAPRGPSLVVEGASAGARINAELAVQIAFSIVGALRIPAHVAGLWLLDSIVDGHQRDAEMLVAAVSDENEISGPPAHIERSTLFGACTFLKLTMASESIFTDTVTVEQRQAGCVRFSWLPLVSETPPQYRCQPRLELARRTEEMRAAAFASSTPLPLGWDTALAAEVAGWLVPAFSSHRHGRPDFAQLHATSPLEIRTGAEDGSEMGVFCLLKQPQRESNLRLRLDEYLPVGLEAGIFYVT